MSDNKADGQKCYEDAVRNEDTKTLAWFDRQWGMWPTRADPNSTTNISFLYGGMIAYEISTGERPPMSHDLKTCFNYLDKFR